MTPRAQTLHRAPILKTMAFYWSMQAPRCSWTPSHAGARVCFLKILLKKVYLIFCSLLTRFRMVRTSRERIRTFAYNVYVILYTLYLIPYTIRL